LEEFKTSMLHFHLFNNNFMIILASLASASAFDDWRIAQEEMLKSYLETAQSDLKAKQVPIFKNSVRNLTLCNLFIISFDFFIMNFQFLPPGAC